MASGLKFSERLHDCTVTVTERCETMGVKISCFDPKYNGMTCTRVQRGFLLWSLMENNTGSNIICTRIRKKQQQKQP